MKSINSLQYNVIFRAEPEGGYTVIVPSLPGCVSYGKTLEQAKEMATDAIGGYIASLEKHNEPLPTDAESFMSSIPYISKKHLVHA